MKLKRIVKNPLQWGLQRLGCRAVSRDWGPRGFLAAFAELRRAGCSPECIWDVGANRGSWTAEARTVFPDSRYVLIEPAPTYGPVLSRLADGNAAIDFLPCALGAANTTTQIHLHAGQSSLLASTYSDGLKAEIEVRTADDLVASGACPPPDLIKADVQGYELQLLRGAERTLERCRFLFLELSWLQLYEHGPYAGHVLGFLADRGFHVFDICSYAQRPLDHRLVQSDVLLAHEQTKLFDERRWR